MLTSHGSCVTCRTSPESKKCVTPLYGKSDAVLFVGVKETRTYHKWLLCRAVLIMVSPAASSAKEVTASSAEKNWREAATQVQEAADSAASSQPAQPPAQLQFEVLYVQSNADACKALHRALAELR